MKDKEMKKVKAEKKSRKKITEIIRPALIGALCATVIVPTVTFAKKNDSDFDPTAGKYKNGWTSEKKQEAWTSYVATDWKVIGNLYFADDSLIKLKIDDKNAEWYTSDEEEWPSEMKKVLKNEQYGSYFKQANYKKLFMAMLYCIRTKATSPGNDWTIAEHTKSNAKDTNDQADENAKKITGEDPESTNYDSAYTMAIYGLEKPPKSTYSSLSILASHYFDAEKEYLNSEHDSGSFDYSLTDSSSEALKVIIQAAIYGSGYAKQDEYSAESAKKWRKEHKTISYDDFADDVIDIYYTVKVSGASSDHAVNS